MKKPPYLDDVPEPVEITEYPDGDPELPAPVDKGAEEGDE